MDGTTHIDSELLARYVAGEADAAQRGTVEHWATLSPQNARELDTLRSIWGMAGTAVSDVDVDGAWERMSARLAAAHHEQDARVIPMRRTPSVLRWVAAAAVVGGVVFAARFFFTSGSQELMASTEHVRATLNDSSRVTLSPASSMNVRMGDERRVALRGEAYFEVHRDPTRPFVIEAGDVNVTVLGTAFEVSAYDTARIVLIRVREGRVQVVAVKDTVEITAGEHARYDRQRNLLERTPAPPAETFGDRVIQFEGASMVQVVEQLQRVFSVRIELQEPALAKCMLTAGFEDETIDTILGVIADTFGLRVTRSAQSTYYLDGDGC